MKWLEMCRRLSTRQQRIFHGVLACALLAAQIRRIVQLMRSSSPRTVEMHVQSILTKLDCRSRAAGGPAGQRARPAEETPRTGWSEVDQADLTVVREEGEATCSNSALLERIQCP